MCIGYLSKLFRLEQFVVLHSNNIYFCIKSCDPGTGFCIRSCDPGTGFCIRSCSPGTGFCIRSCDSGTGFCIRSCDSGTGFCFRSCDSGTRFLYQILWLWNPIFVSDPVTLEPVFYILLWPWNRFFYIFLWPWNRFIVVSDTRGAGRGCRGLRVPSQLSAQNQFPVPSPRGRSTGQYSTDCTLVAVDFHK